MLKFFLYIYVFLDFYIFGHLLKIIDVDFIFRTFMKNNNILISFEKINNFDILKSLVQVKKI